MKNPPRILLAGTNSGCGKTTVTIALLSALKQRGSGIAPCKVGPDYIDPGFHQYVCGEKSINLDSWLNSEESLRFLFHRHVDGDSIAVIEGVMGLYDGFGTGRDQGSSAHVSKILKTPVILVVNARGMSASAAAMVLGYLDYDPEVNIVGVILNGIGNDAHYKLLREPIERDVGVPCLGYLPIRKELSLESRHLGLIPAEELPELEEKIQKLGELAEKHIDIERILTIAGSAIPVPIGEDPFKQLGTPAKGMRLGIAKDKAFSFYYEDNLKLLRQLGFELIPFSPLEDETMPGNLQGIYLGGGFPEVFAEELEQNRSFQDAFRALLEQGIPCYAECGGLMYLCESIKKLDGSTHQMSQFLPTKIEMTKRLQRFGYVEVAWRGIKFRAHEFHHSVYTNTETLALEYDIKKFRNDELHAEWSCGIRKGNVLAAYAHVHFYNQPEFLLKLIDHCKKVNHGIH